MTTEMKIWAYADTHIGTRQTMKELEISPDYSKCQQFVNLVKSESPGLVICLGDFTESIWDTDEELNGECGTIIQSLQRITHKFLKGNHDKDGEDIIELNNIRFLHGHQFERAANGYIERLHRKADLQDKYIVVAHTHSPCLGTNFMDVGSLTLTGTFGEVNGGKKIIHNL